MIRFLQHGFGDFPAGAKQDPMQWSHHDLFFVHEGEVVIGMPGRASPQVLGTGQGLLIWPSTEFSWRVDGALSVRASIQHFFLQDRVVGEWVTPLRKKNGYSSQKMPPSPMLLADVSRAVDQARADDGSPRWQRLREALLMIILESGGFLEDDLAGNIDPRIDLHLAERAVLRHLAAGCSVADLAVVFDLSASRFRALFREEHGFSAGAFIRRVRHCETQRLLVETRMPLKEIAERVGLADTVVLGRTFRHETGETPARFRRQNRILG